eukprot:1180823-Prorocentrum_minimum.AAC.4
MREAQGRTQRRGSTRTFDVREESTGELNFLESDGMAVRVEPYSRALSVSTTDDQSMRRNRSRSIPFDPAGVLAWPSPLPGAPPLVLSWLSAAFDGEPHELRPRSAPLGPALGEPSGAKRAESSCRMLAPRPVRSLCGRAAAAAPSAAAGVAAVQDKVGGLVLAREDIWLASWLAAVYCWWNWRISSRFAESGRMEHISTNERMSSVVDTNKRMSSVGSCLWLWISTLAGAGGKLRPKP